MNDEEIRLKALTQLALVDGSFDDIEQKFIKNIGIANNISEKKIETIIHEQLKQKKFDDITFTNLTTNQRLDYLVSLVSLMKVDGKIYLSEINYCKDLAEKLGYQRSIIKKIISKIHIYSNDLEEIKKDIKHLTITK